MPHPTKDNKNGDDDSSSAPSSQRPAQQQQQLATAAELAKALQELAKGEQAASLIEDDLTKLEEKLDSILAALEAGSPPDAVLREAEHGRDGEDPTAKQNGGKETDNA